MVMTVGCSASSPPPWKKIRPRIENQITIGKRRRHRVGVVDHQVLVILKFEMGTLQCRTVLGFLQKEQRQQTLGKTNMVSISAKPRIQEVIHPTSVVVKHIIWFDKEVLHGI